MMRVTLLIVAVFALVGVSWAQEHHEKCCHACNSSYIHAHHLKSSCMHGCRLYGMIYLAHDKTIKESEVSGMCAKSCNKGYTGMLGGADARKACASGCSHQEAMFHQHKPGHRVAQMAVIHGLTMMPTMHSAVPFHRSIFQQMRAMHHRMMLAMRNAKAVTMRRVHIRIQSLPAGADGKPRYHVEIHQFPVIAGHFAGHLPGHHHQHGRHHPRGHHGGRHHPHSEIDFHARHGRHHRGGVLHRVRHFFTDMPHSAKVVLRTSLCGMLVLSVIGLLWLCCNTFRANRPRPRLSLAKVFEKKPQVQSGDIFYVDVDKKPLMEDDSVDKASRDEA